MTLPQLGQRQHLNHIRVVLIQNQELNRGLYCNLAILRRLPQTNIWSDYRQTVFDSVTPRRSDIREAKRLRPPHAAPINFLHDPPILIGPRLVVNASILNLDICKI